MAEEESGEKPHEPTAKKLEDARRKGEVASSTDLTAAAVYGGLILAGLAGGAAALGGSATLFSSLLDQADEISKQIFSGAAAPLYGALIIETARWSWLWFIIPALLAIVTLIAQRAIVFAPEKLALKPNRLSPIANAGQKFGRKGLFEFAKSTLKLVLYAAILSLFLWQKMPRIAATIASEPAAITQQMLILCLQFFTLVFVTAAVLGALDYMWQRGEHLRRNRMSHKELTDESKESEGDPWLKSARRQRGYDIATNQMLADVPEADVVIVNPRHFAVALKWQRAGASAPVCVAKGVDEIAARIREAAIEAAVPIHRDPPTARLLYANVDLGEEIHPDHYRAVAAAIRFAAKMRQRATARR